MAPVKLRELMAQLLELMDRRLLDPEFALGSTFITVEETVDNFVCQQRLTYSDARQWPWMCADALDRTAVQSLSLMIVRQTPLLELLR